jgi:hypothetical protein
LPEQQTLLTVPPGRSTAPFLLKPLTFVHTPKSPLYATPEEAVAANLNYIISTQKADGGWGLTWSWEERDSVAWKLAEKEWRGVVTLENLERLKAFHRIAHEPGGEMIDL